MKEIGKTDKALRPGNIVQIEPSDGVPQKHKIAGINPVDREFLENIFYKIEQNIGNSEYNVTKLSLVIRQRII